eukprot:scaffold442242_cov16-Prasinocladus_malaysianus.AAC.2
MSSSEHETGDDGGNVNDGESLCSSCCGPTPILAVVMIYMYECLMEWRKTSSPKLLRNDSRLKELTRHARVRYDGLLITSNPGVPCELFQPAGLKGRLRGL